MPTIHTVAGTGQRGADGDGGPAVDARFDQPFHVALDPQERHLYVADCFNFRVRRVDLLSGMVTTFAGTGQRGYSGDGGPATEARLDEVYAIQVDASGDVYIVQRFHPAVRKIDAATGTITTVAGDGTVGYRGDGGPGHRAQLREPNDCCLDGRGGLLIADVQDQRIRRLDIKTGVITTFAGTGEKAHTGDGGPAMKAAILGARAVCVDGRGNTYICEREGSTIRVVDSNGTIATFAGTGGRGYAGDGGPAIRGVFDRPKGVRCDRRGNLFVVDTEDHAIRRIDAATGVLTTVAGGHRGPEGDGGEATAAGLARPHGVEIDSRGNLYIADSENHRVRVVALGA